MITAGMEFLLPYSVFFRRVMVFRESELTKKYLTLDENFLFPFNSIMHVLDNVASPEQTIDVPRMDLYPFLKNRSVRKFVYHFDGFDTLDWNSTPQFPKRIYLSKLSISLVDFNITNKKFIRKINALEGNADYENDKVYTVYNHNPLYRILALGPSNIIKYNQFQFIFWNMLKSISVLRNKNHFVFIPLIDEMYYPKSNFFGMFSSGDISNSRLISSNHCYFFLIQLLTFLLDNRSSLSLFSRLDNDTLQRMNFVLVHKGRSFSFNMATMASILNTKSKVWKLLGSIYALTHSPSINADKFVENFEKINEIEQKEEIVATPSDKKPNIVEKEDEKATVVKPMKFGFSKVPDTTKSGSVEDDFKFDEEDPIFDDSELNTEEDKKILAQIDELDKINSSGIVSSKPITINEDKIEPVVPSITVVEETTYKESSKNMDVKPIYQHIREETEKFIENYPLATVAQKKRAAILAEKHKTISIRTSSGKVETIDKIVSSPIDIIINPDVMDSVKDKMADKSMIDASSVNFDSDYMDKLFTKDVLANVLSFQTKGLFVINYEESDEFNNFNKIKHIKVQFEDIKGKRHTVRFKLPVPDDDGYFVVNGVKLSMKKQLVNLPICKISPIRVSLISNFNKTIVEKVTTGIYDICTVFKQNINDWNTDNPSDKIEMISHLGNFIDHFVPYEYAAIGSKVLSVKTKEYEIFFGVNDRFSHFELEEEATRKLELKYGILLGKVVRSKEEYIFLNNSNEVLIVNTSSENIIKRGMSIFSLIFGEGKITVPHEWCNLKILDKNIPIIFILAYRYGLTNTLKYLNIKYRTVPRGKSLNLTTNEIPITFKDMTIVFKRYPLLNSFILSGLRHYTTLKSYEFHQFDDKDIFYQLLQDKGMSINYLKGIDNTIDFFIDPITREVLQEMGEPTNTRDLLIRAVEMLVTKKTIDPAALENFRIRSIEKFSAVAYNEIARQYANYLSSNFKDKSFSINTEAIFQRIIQDQTMDLKEEINPIQSIKEQTKISYTGYGGRSSEAFVERDRKFSKDALGILSEATPDSGNVAMVAYLSANPNIKNLRGMLNTNVKQEDLTPTNILSDTSMLMPGASNDD